ncbi:MAG: phosphatase PAP2 family protein [Candidatus Eremiobacteraeota bacterium]|nr:phosphatase PAP2 family protein [Candidatus Eremiobacteraeota bacterium]
MTSRKGFLSGGALAAGALLNPQEILAASGAQTVPAPGRARRKRALTIRETAARAHYLGDIASNETNGDEQRYADKRASFSKTLSHDDLGEVHPADFARFVEIIERGKPGAFETMPRDSYAVERLNDPQAMYAYEFVADDSAATTLAAPPAFASAKMAVEMGELYWHALTRDVPLAAFASDPTIAAAAADLNMFSDSLDATHTRVAPTTLFRAPFAGASSGPFVSQFLWLDVPYGPTTITQRYHAPASAQNFLTKAPEWLACQRGAAAKNKIVNGSARWLATTGDLAAYVHKDFSFQAFVHAALIAMSYGNEALSPTNPYRGSKTEFGDITFGNKMFLTLIAQAALVAQKTSYYHKWLVHRRARPEVTAGRLQHQLTGRKDYGLHPDLARCDAVARTKSLQGTAFLSIAYPEGCPTHPSYPAAHACNAGACVALLKAFFNEAFVIPNAVVADATGEALQPWRGEPLTLGGEFEKLGSNIAFSRHAAGVHYRSDSVAGLYAGEAQGVSLLSDYSRTFNERFSGFELTTFAGKRVRIRNGTESA